MSGRPAFSFIAWTSNRGRATDIAADLSGEAYCVYPFKTSGAAGALLRYVVSAVLTVGHLVRRRPRAVIVTNPPVIPALLVWSWSRVARCPFVMDSHPTAFGAKDHRVSQCLAPVHRFLMKRASAVLVTAEEWVAQVNASGGTGIVLHEPPVPMVPPLQSTGSSVFYIGTFASDEPLQPLLDAARLMPETTFHVTGDVGRAPEAALRSAPGNVTFTGYLRGDDYRRALASATVVVVLTTEPTSVMRGAYEAVWNDKPLVVSDTPLLRDLFPEAIFTANEGDALTAAIGQAVAARDDTDRWSRARRGQSDRWAVQRNRLIEALAP